MITITDSATQAIHRARTERSIPDDRGVRLAPDETGLLRLMFDAPHARDMVVRNGGVPLLIVEAGIAPRLDEAVLDYMDTEGNGNPKFTLLRQRESRLAGSQP